MNSASVPAAAVTVDPSGIELLLTNGLRTFFIKGKPDFINGRKSLSQNSPDYPVLCNWVFDDFILAGGAICKSFPKTQNCVLLIILFGRLYSPLELLITFVDRLKVTSVQFFTPGFNLLSW